MQLGEALAPLRRRVVGQLVAIPARIPDLTARAVGLDRLRQWQLKRVEDDDDARLTAVAAQRLDEPLRLLRRQRCADGARQPRDRAVTDARRINRNYGRRAQQVFGLLAQDELLQLAGQQQHADRLPFIGL